MSFRIHPIGEGDLARVRARDPRGERRHRRHDCVHLCERVRKIARHIWNRATSGGPRMLKPGDPAPDFEVLDNKRNTVRLRDLRGKKVVLWFYPKADTPG